MAENHALGEMQKIASEKQINEFKRLLASKEQKLRKLIFAINNMKEEKNTKQEQYEKRGDNSIHGERDISVY